MNFVIFKNDKILLERKPKGKWKVPGGHIESNETPLEALRREVEEELGIAVFFPNEKQWLDDIDDCSQLLTPVASLIHNTNGDSVLQEPHKNVVYVYTVETEDDPIAKEGQEIRWFDTNEFETKNDSIIEVARKIVLKSLESSYK
jgi:8-oxo-dGTP pyrophosphatase MutT (NUDIX family)